MPAAKYCSQPEVNLGTGSLHYISRRGVRPPKANTKQVPSGQARPPGHIA